MSTTLDQIGLRLRKLRQHRRKSQHVLAATLHAFNGWADLFPTTPAAGLRDTYLKVSANLPGGLKALAGHHWFTTERGGPAPGREFDLQLVRKFGPRVTVLGKYANFRRTAAAYPQVQKVWAQVEFAY